MAEKEFKTIVEQIELLKSRGLSIPDETTAGSFLLHNNYYRVSGYSLTLDSHQFWLDGQNAFIYNGIVNALSMMELSGDYCASLGSSVQCSAAS